MSIAHPLKRLDHCLNCGSPVLENFCAYCGQENEDQKASVKELVSDMLAEIASFDSRLVRTLIPLLFRPGFLTLQYNAGKRVSYLSPLKMYLTISALFFLVLSATQHIPASIVKADFSGAPSRSALAENQKEIAKDQKEIARDRTKLNDPKTDPDDLADLKSEILDDQKEIASDQAAILLIQHPLAPKKNMAASRDAEASPIHGDIVIGDSKAFDLSKLPDTLPQYEAQQNDPANTQKHPAFVRNIVEHLYKLKSDKQGFVDKLMDTIPKMMFFLVPLFALNLQLLYLRSKRFYVEHLIFALHNHAFLFAVLGIMTLFGWSALAPVHKYLSWVSGVLSVALPIYFLIAMRIVYRQSWGKTVLKFLLAGFNYMILLTFAFVATLTVAFMSF